MKRNNKTKKCYIFGTFNPIHNSHIKIADFLLTQGFDKAVFVPAYRPPHKDFDEKQAQKRLEMVKLAVKDHKNFEVDDIEFKRKTPSYTYDTIKQIYKGERINFAIGTDAFEKIETWYEIDKLKNMLNFLVFDRQNDFDPKKFDYLKQKGFVFEIMKMPFYDVSSTEIRKKIKSGEDFSTLVDKNVLKYIYEHEVFK